MSNLPPDDSLLQTRIKKSMISIQLHDLDHFLCHSCSICRCDLCRPLYISCPPSPIELLFHIAVLRDEKYKFWTMQTDDETCDAISGKVSVLFKSTCAQYFFVKNTNLVVQFFHTGLFDVANDVIL